MWERQTREMTVEWNQRRIQRTTYVMRVVNEEVMVYCKSHLGYSCVLHRYHAD